ncbi:UNKNOWN [Stylonychia lemnae]|uniref:Uncharacterized protein n=1 Tax=Stylonychia lemnae TaxID=5949 RepID=A0A078ABK7_STYLE|nr:UNKNOWN [Stylonychia lemnae]|eukprot:CDW78962.1 UNKNOWN [Stylonychia lemnae]
MNQRNFISQFALQKSSESSQRSKQSLQTAFLQLTSLSSDQPSMRNPQSSSNNPVFQQANSYQQILSQKQQEQQHSIQKANIYTPKKYSNNSKKSPSSSRVVHKSSKERANKKGCGKLVDSLMQDLEKYESPSKMNESRSHEQLMRKSLQQINESQDSYSNDMKLSKQSNTSGFLDRSAQQLNSSFHPPQQPVQQQREKTKTTSSQTRGTQQPQQIQHKMSQKRLVDEIKQLNKKMDMIGIFPNTNTAQMNMQQINNQSKDLQDLQNLSLRLQGSLPLQSIGRNSQQGIYQNMQMRSAPGVYNNIANQQNNTNVNNTFSGINTSGLLAYNEKPQMMSSNGYQQINQVNNTFIGQMPNTIGLNSLAAKDKVTMDKKTYEELMNYLVKVECKRIEKDKNNQLNHYQNKNTQGTAQISGKRPNSTLKRLGQNTQERFSHNPRQFNQNRELIFNRIPTQNLNNSSFLSAAPNSLGRNSKLRSNTEKSIVQSSSLRQIKRNNYVNDITQAYNHQTENIQKGLIQQNNIPQVSPFFNINQSQSIPTSKKGTQKKIVLQDKMVQEYQEMTQPKLQEMLQSGKYNPQKEQIMINPQQIYMAEKIQSARGNIKGTGKDLISGVNKVSNLLMHKEKMIKNNIGVVDSKQPLSQRDNQSSKQQSQRIEENNLIKRLTSAKNKKETKEEDQVLIDQNYFLNHRQSNPTGAARLNIQLDSDLLYGSNVTSHNNIQVILKDDLTANEEYLLEHQKHTNFDTFGDSENNKKVTAVSELHSPDHRMASPRINIQSYNNSIRQLSQKDQADINAYQNQGYQIQEFHYSGSFGVPMTLQNQSYQIDANNKLIQSMIQNGQNNLSFSIVGQNDMSIVSQEQLRQNKHAYIDNKGAIVIQDNELIYDDPDEDDENDDEIQQIIDKPFYLPEYQDEEEFFEQEKFPEQVKTTISPSSKSQNYHETDLQSIDNSTVEAVKKKLITDPDYRRELLQRVLPQFSKLNEQFTNSFLYKLKYANEDSSQNSNSLQKSNQSTYRQGTINHQLMSLNVIQSQSSLNSKIPGNMKFSNIVSSEGAEEYDLDELYTFDQRNNDTLMKQDHGQAVQALLKRINQNLNTNNSGGEGLNTMMSSQSRKIDNQDFDMALIDDKDEINTVIENDCDNDYADIYQSIGEDDAETEELRRKREFEYQKLLLKREIMMVAGTRQK